MPSEPGALGAGLVPGPFGLLLVQVPIPRDKAWSSHSGEPFQFSSLFLDQHFLNRIIVKSIIDLAVIDIQFSFIIRWFAKYLQSTKPLFWEFVYRQDLI